MTKAEITRTLRDGNLVVMSEDGILTPDSYFMVALVGDLGVIRNQNIAVNKVVTAIVAGAVKSDVPEHELRQMWEEAIEYIYAPDEEE